MLLFGKITLFKLPYSSIKSIKKANLIECFSPAGVHYVTRFFGQRVIIEKTNGLLKYIFLTPKDPDEFISKVAKKTKNKLL